MTNQHPTIVRLERRRHEYMHRIIEAARKGDLETARKIAAAVNTTHAMIQLWKAQQAARLAAA